MTVPATTRRAGPFTGNGVTSTFPFAFKVFTSADLAVVRATSGVENALALGTDYTVSLNVDQDATPGGTVNLTAPLAAGDTLAIVGDIDYDQQLDLPGGGAFRPLALENALDRTVIQIQQLREEVGRTLRVPVTSDASIELPAPEAVKLLGWDSSATGLQNYDALDLLTAQLYADWTFDTFTGNGTATSFPLQRSPGSLGNIDVSIDGVTQVPGVDYAVSGSTLAFTSPPPNGTEILARYGSSAVQGVLGFTTEYKTAGAGQTVFTLTNPYTPGGSNLKVYVNGLAVRGGVDYLETDATTVTFTSGLSLNDDVRFEVGGTTNAAAAASQVGYSTVGGTSESAKTRFDRVVYVTDFPGVDPTGTTDSSAGIQAAVNWAIAQAASGTQSTDPVRTVGVFFPDGQYRINTGISIAGGGVALFGGSGRGARLFTTTSSAITMFTVGDVTDTVNTIEVHFANLAFDTTQLENNNHTAIAAYRSFFGSVTDCYFLGFYDAVVGFRMNRWMFTRNRTSQRRASVQARSSFRFRGSASGSGGGLHITNNEFNGGGSLGNSVSAHLLLEECDGLYAASNHTRDCDDGIRVAPAGVTGANVIDSLYLVNNYFDENYRYNVFLTGTVAAGGRYQVVKFVNNYMRGSGGASTNGVRVDITATGGVVPRQFSFIGGEIRQHSAQGIRVLGSPSGRTDVRGLVVQGVQFEANNWGGVSASSAISVEALGVVLTSNMVGPDQVACANVVQVTSPQAVVSNNNFAAANNTGEAVNFTQATSGRSLILANNLPQGFTFDLDQAYPLTTTDATTTTIWEMVVPQGAAGRAVIDVTGVTSDGASAISYTFEARYRRNAGGTTLSGGAFTTTGSWNPDAFATPPTATLAGNTLRVQVTGRVSTTINWVAHVQLRGAR